MVIFYYNFLIKLGGFMKAGSLSVITCICVFVLFVIASCPYPSPEPEPTPEHESGANGLVVLWKGENASPPIGTRTNWAYYNTTTGNAYIYVFINYRTSWQALPYSGVSLIWKGNASSHPASPQKNWGYYNSTDEKTYIYTGNEWRELLSGKAIGPEGILLENMMELIPAGTFTMGSPVDEPDRRSDETQHQVTLSKDFYMGKYPVTQWEWYAVTETFDGFGWGDGKLYKNNVPVIWVSWYDAIEFCNKLSMLEGLNPVYSLNGETAPDKWETNGFDSWKDVEMLSDTNGYRLPTEAEWEYACRAGTSTVFNWGTNQITTDQANYDGSEMPYNGSPVGLYRNGLTPVWGFTPNAWGLYNMHGNVEEYCWDRYGEDYYENSPELDPQGPASGDYRVSRGGSWYVYGLLLRSACRFSRDPDGWSNDQGFRLVRSAE
jgi:formylglycine-generating enzyme required for sulfatase activity